MRKYFIAGLLVWVPVVITIMVIHFMVSFLDQILDILPDHLQPDYLIGFHIPGLGLIAVAGLLVLTGIFVANLFGKKFVAWSESLLAKIPLIRGVYLGSKQVMETLFGPGSASFRQVFLIQYPREGLWTLAFQTAKGLEEAREAVGEELISVYVPTTPNPTSGFLLMVKKDSVIPLTISVDEALKLVISLGVVSPDQLLRHMG